MPTPLPKVEVQKIIHYAMPPNLRPGTVKRLTICGFGTLVPGRKIRKKDTRVTCKSCIAVVRQVHLHAKP